jgi:hypothetical protein
VKCFPAFHRSHALRGHADMDASASIGEMQSVSERIPTETVGMMA